MGFFEKQKLTGPNFIDWYRKLRIVLSIEDKLNYLEQPIPHVPVAPAGQQVAPEILAAHSAWVKGSKEIAGLMLMTMKPKIQQNLEPLHAYEMLKELKTLFAQQAEQELLQTTRDFHSCRQEEGQSVSSYVLKMKGYIDNLERLGNPMTLGLGMTTSSNNNSVFRGFFEKQKLTGPNFIDWYRQLKIVLSIEDKLNYLEQPIPYVPVAPAGQQVAPKILAAHTAWEEGQSMSSYVLKMKGYIDNLECLGHPVTLGLGVSLILIGLRKEYDGFVQNYNINKRAKLDLDSALLWHYRLGHISKKRIEKFSQHDGLLNSSDLMAFEKCVSYKEQATSSPSLTTSVEVENQLGKTIKSLCSDRGGEYMSQEFLDHLKDYEIIDHRTPPYTPQHNDVSERRNRTLLDMVEKTPYEVWHGKVPKLSYLKVWGCEALVKRDTLTKPDKLEPRSIKCIFVGYPKETMGYSFYYPPENKVIVARNAEFLENSLIDQEASGSQEDVEIIQEENTHHSLDTSLNQEEEDLEIDEPQSDIVPIRRSTRTRHASDRMCLYIDAEEHELGDLGEPANYKAALLDPESEKWLNAMNMTTSSTNNSVFRGFFEKQKLTGPKFIDWYRQLKIVLSIEDKLNYLEQPIPSVPVAPAEPLHAHEMLKELKTLFAQQAEQELLQTTRDFHSCRQEEGQSVSSYVLKMKGYIDNLERLGHPVTLGLGVSLILISLRKEYDGFVQNYNMYSMGKIVNELHAMLKLHEQTLPKSNAPALNAIRDGKVQKVNKHKKSHSQKGTKGQNQGNGKFTPKPKIPPPPKRENPAKDSICHECGEIGHWKRNCPQYLAELMKKKNTASGAGGSSIFVIELNT
nr:hypothetical protein [Tanacetum cinerariifolium]